MRIAALTCAAAALWGGQALAQSPDAGTPADTLTCGETHVVVRGDTLQKLVDSVYGPDQSYMVLYRANRAVIGRDPSQIEKGQVLEIPCLNEAGEPVDGNPDDRLRLVAGPARPPSLDETEGAGGVVTEIVRAALLREMPSDDFTIDFRQDGVAPLETFLGERAHDLSLAWVKPDCAGAAPLGEEARFRCERLAWSDPIFEGVISYHTRAADASERLTHGDLIGKTICRPAGAALFMLEAHGLAPPDVTLMRPETAKACFAMLTAGEADVVVAAAIAAEDAIRRLGVAGQVAEYPELADLATMHAVAPIDASAAREKLAMLNAGLAALREDGEWFAIVERRLAAHAQGEAPPVR